MKKEQFLREIQRQATREGSFAEKIWYIAAKVDEKDGRWQAIEEHDVIDTFARAFGVEIPEVVPMKFKSQSEILTKKLVEAKETYELVKTNKPHFVEEALKGIKRLEKKIAEAIKEEEEEA